MFELKNVKYLEILNIESLFIEDYKTTCIFGPSGSGKTTILKLLAGLVSPDSGEILFDDENLDNLDLTMLRRKVIMLGQEPCLFPGDLRENLNLGAYFQDRENFKDEELIEVLEKVKLGEKNLDSNPEIFSQGEKQRLCLARILLLKPEVLLLDEPSSALDADIETMIMELVKEYKGLHNMTVVLVTHSDKIAKLYSDKIAYIEAGKIASCVDLNCIKVDYEHEGSIENTEFSIGDKND